MTFLRSSRVEVLLDDVQFLQTVSRHTTTSSPSPRFCDFAVMAVICLAITYSRVWINPVRLPIFLVVSEEGKIIFPCPRSRLKGWSRETGSAVWPRVSLLILHTQAESGAYSRNSSHFPRRRLFIYTADCHRVKAYRFTQLRTDGVHCRESPAQGQFRYHHGPINMRLFFSTHTIGR